jgi:hypothetical protein
MRITKFFLTACAACLLALPALAQPGEEGGDRPPADPEIKQKLLDNFDTNKDGTIDRSEARAIGRGLRENFDIGPQGRGPDDRGPRDRGPGGPGGRGRGDRADRGPDGPPRGEARGQGRGDGRGEGRGPQGRRGPGGPDGPGRPDGPPRGPNPERIFNLFDENDDGSLSKEEFMTMHEFVQSMRHHGPPPWARGGREFGGRGPDDRRGPPRGNFEGRGRGGRGPRGDGPPGPPRPDNPPGPPSADGAEPAGDVDNST